MDTNEHKRSSVSECGLVRLNTDLERLRMENQILLLERDNARSKINLSENTSEYGEKKDLSYPELLTPDRKVGNDCSTPVPDTMFFQELGGDIGSPFLEALDANFPGEKARGRRKSALTRTHDNRRDDVEIKEELLRDYSIETRQSQRPCKTPGQDIPELTTWPRHT